MPPPSPFSRRGRNARVTSEAEPSDKRIEIVAPQITNCAIGDSDEPVIVNENDPPAKRIAAFNQLWKENEKHLRMPKDVNYPINYKRGWSWASHHCDSASVKFAESIIANTAYISFGEFIASIGKICKSFKQFYAGRTTNTVFVLVIPFDMSKSNIWVSLLMWPELREIINDIDFDITSVYNRYIGTHPKTDKNVVCVICDDCAYTGNQLLGYCTLSPHRTQYSGRPDEPSANSQEWIAWNAEVTARVSEIEAKLDVRAFSINLMIPYMSTYAQQNIIDRRFLMVPKDAHIFKLFRERVNIHDFPQGVLREFESTFQYHSNIAAIYFDHKIADAVSTFNKVYLLAPVFGCENLQKSVCFIDGCTNSREIPEGINVYDIFINVEDVLEKRACPRTFYKSIKYTMHGRPITSLCLYDALSGRAADESRRDVKKR